jgi:hypothetical protein
MGADHDRISLQDNSPGRFGSGFRAVMDRDLAQQAKVAAK